MIVAVPLRVPAAEKRVWVIGCLFKWVLRTTNHVRAVAAQPFHQADRST